MNHRSAVQTEKSQPKSQWIMPENREISFPALSVFLYVGISRSSPETDDELYLSPEKCLFARLILAATDLVKKTEKSIEPEMSHSKYQAAFLGILEVYITIKRK